MANGLQHSLKHTILKHKKAVVKYTIMILDAKAGGIHVSDPTSPHQSVGVAVRNFDLREPFPGTNEIILDGLGRENLIKIYRGAQQIRQSSKPERRFVVSQIVGGRNGNVVSGILFAAQALIQETVDDSLKVQRLVPVPVFDPQIIADVQKETWDQNVDPRPQKIFGLVDLRNDPKDIVLVGVDTRRKEFWRMTLHDNDLKNAETVFLNGNRLNIH